MNLIPTETKRYEITDLPTKCMTRILSFLTKEELLELTKAIQLVNCKKFKAPIWRLIGLECFNLRFKEPDYTYVILTPCESPLEFTRFRIQYRFFGILL